MERTAERGDAEDKRLYEVAFHLGPAIAEADLPEEVASVRAVVEKNSGVMVSEHFPEKFALAYPLALRERGKRRVFDSSYFGWIKFEADGPDADAVRRELKKLSSIMRHVVVRTVVERRTLTVAKRSVLERSEAKPEPRVKKTPERAEISDEALDRELEKLVAE